MSIPIEEYERDAYDFAVVLRGALTQTQFDKLRDYVDACLDEAMQDVTDEEIEECE